MNLFSTSTKNKGVINNKIFYFEYEKEGYEVEVAMQYTDRYSELTLSYANNINTVEGGFHLVGLRAALTRLLTIMLEELNFSRIMMTHFRVRMLEKV